MIFMFGFIIGAIWQWKAMDVFIQWNLAEANSHIENLNIYIGRLENSFENMKFEAIRKGVTGAIDIYIDEDEEA